MMSTLRVGTRLLVGYGIMVLLLIVVGVYSLNRMGHLAELTSELYDHPFTVNKAVRDANLALARDHFLLLELAASTNSDTFAADLNAIYEQDKQFLQNMAIVKERYLGKQSDIDEVLRAYEEWKPARDEAIALLKARQNAQATATLGQMEGKQLAALEKEMADLSTFSTNKAAEFQKNAQLAAKESYLLVVALILVAIVIAVSIALTLTGSITRPLRAAVEVAERVGTGDLTVTVPSTASDDELGVLLRTFGRMVDNFRRQTLETLEGVNVLAASAGEIMAATSQVAASAAETATAVSETTATVEEVKQTTQLSSQKSRLVADSAQKSVQVSQGGRKAVEDSIDGMNRIREQMETIAETIVGLSEQTQAIGEIIASVNDLAEQSNLLAVNASIEAAKAGEHGKGFAVVAQEVKSLAEQSKQATAQVRSILNDIQRATSAAVMATEQGSKAVEAGEKQATAAGEAIRSLAESIAESAQASTQIMATSQQQMIGMDQVALAMENIKNASTLSVTSTKQAELSAQNLNELGQKLKQLVERFRL